MTRKRKQGSGKPPSSPGTPAKQNLNAAAQRRQALRAHYAAKYRSR